VGLLLALSLADELGELISALRETEDLEERVTIQIQLVFRAAKKDVPRILSEIEAGPPGIRPHLIAVLGHLSALPELRIAATKCDPVSKCHVAWQMRRLGDEAGGRQILISTLAKTKKPEHLTPVLHNLHPRLYPGEETVKAILEFLEREKGEKATWDDEVPRRVAIRIVGLHEDKRIDPCLEKLVESREKGMWGEALAALAMRRVAGAMERLLVEIEAGRWHENDSWAVARALRFLGARDAQARIRKVLENGSIAPIRIVRWSLDRSCVLTLIRVATESKGQPVAEEAAEAVADLSTDPAQIRKVAEGGSPKVRLAAGRALVRLDEAGGYEVLGTLRKEENREVRRDAVRAVAGRADAPAADLLLDFLEDPDKEIAREARDGLLKTWSALFPYRDIDKNATPAEYRAWWKSRRR
jgi:HEAT repeat protein